MSSDRRRSVSVEAREHGISGQLMNWLLKTQGRMEGSPGRFRASAKYAQYEHRITNNYGYSYDPEFFVGVDLSEKAIAKAKSEWEKFKKKQPEMVVNSTNVNGAASQKKGFFTRLIGFLSNK